jgi:hypothetical protein
MAQQTAQRSHPGPKGNTEQGAATVPGYQSGPVCARILGGEICGETELLEQTGGSLRSHQNAVQHGPDHLPDQAAGGGDGARFGAFRGSDSLSGRALPEGGKYPDAESDEQGHAGVAEGQEQGYQEGKKKVHPRTDQSRFEHQAPPKKMF